MAYCPLNRVIRQPRLVSFQTSHDPWQRLLDRAIDGLRANVVDVPGADERLLIEGGPYRGAWLESGPIDARALAIIDCEPYLAVHRVFFSLQRDDGQLPCFVRRSGIGWSQIQTVTSIAVTALHCALHYGDEEFLVRAYERCCRWDCWLVRYRDTRSLGLCEAFCEYDTGHDKSPRFAGLPKVAEGRDARFCPRDPRLPYLAPDLSASLYGGRIALAEMAERLGRDDEAAVWRAKAQQTREAIFEHCFDSGTLCFYDRDGRGDPVRIASDVLLRVMAEGVVEPELADRIFDCWVLNERAFWTPLPMPSIAANDPAFDWALPANSWAGATQTLTALRAPTWFEKYGRYTQLAEMMRRWLTALSAAESFRQQADPRTGEFRGEPGYSPAMAVVVDYLLRLQGVIPVDQGTLSWGCGGAEGETRRCELRTEQGDAVLNFERGVSSLRWNGQVVLAVRGDVRVLTDVDGVVHQVISIASDPQSVTVELPSCESRTAVLSPNEQMRIAAAPMGTFKAQVIA